MYRYQARRVKIRNQGRKKKVTGHTLSWTSRKFLQGPHAISVSYICFKELRPQENPPPPLPPFFRWASVIRITVMLVKYV